MERDLAFLVFDLWYLVSGTLAVLVLSFVHVLYPESYLYVICMLVFVSSCVIWRCSSSTGSFL